MSKYTITMDYVEFQRLQKFKNDFINLKSRLSKCINKQENTYLINIEELKEIAKEQLPFEIDKGDIFIDV